MIHPDDVSRWRSKLDQIEAAAAEDPEVTDRWAAQDQVRPDHCAQAQVLVAEFRETRDFDAFRKGVDSWARHQEGPFSAFVGFGMMWFNQVAKKTPEGIIEVVSALSEALLVPADVAAASAKIDAVREVTKDLVSNGNPALRRIPFILSLFWSTADVQPAWPCMWPTAGDRLQDLGWTLSDDNFDRWPVFLEAARALCPEDVHRFDRLMWFLSEKNFVGLNPSLADMCVEAAGVMALHDRTSGYPNDTKAVRARSLAFQLKGDLGLAGSGLLPVINSAVGLDLRIAKITPRIAFDKNAAFRADTYTAWSVSDEAYAPNLRLWATRSGMALGVHAFPGSSPGDAADLAERIANLLPKGTTHFKIQPHLSGDRLVPVDAYDGRDVFVGFWWTWGDLPAGLEVVETLRERAASLAPALQVLADSRPVAAAASAPAPTGDGPLAGLLARFKAERPYPTDRDVWHNEERVRFADAFSAENLSTFDLDRFRKLINGPRYGGPGPQANLNSTLTAMDEGELDDFAENLSELLWGDGSVAERFDRGLDRDDLGVKGLSDSVLWKLFAVTQPEAILPIFPLKGPSGKIAMLKELSLPEPANNPSRGAMHVEANDTLRACLESLLPGDPWGQTQFCYWMLQDAIESTAPDVDLLGQAAEDLLVPEPFLRELEELVQEKGQIIFYGPPGTGKTFIADRFAAAIQPDPERRMTVQFHPSMSYEDFFEGYRPVTEDRQLFYELRKGPLALMAEKAEAAPGLPHVLIIDEINRANLPRVFGELLYLLEYRKKSVRTAYRADEPFELPKNLFFIGTMNTADRSIAMIDAALRRRFHFVPFMPHDGPLANVLAKWLKLHGEPGWIAPLVDQVNERLRVILRGAHLQIGHSHFMLAGAAAGSPNVLTDQRLERIWNYGIFPFIEDQLHGKPDQLAHFSWPSVLKEFGPQAQQAAADAADAAAAADGDGDVEPTGGDLGDG